MKHTPHAKRHRKKLRAKHLFSEALKEQDEIRRKKMMRRARFLDEMKGA